MCLSVVRFNSIQYVERNLLLSVTSSSDLPLRTIKFTISILDKKREARLHGSTEDWRKYKGIFKARAKQDLENYYSSLAEEGVKRHSVPHG